MTLRAFLTLVRARIRDEEGAGFTDDVLTDYTNEALAWAYQQLAANGRPDYLKPLTVVPGVSVPSDWMRPAGLYPVTILGGKFNLLCGDYVTVLYHPYPVRLSSLDDAIPLRDGDLPMILERIATLALSRHEFDTTVEQQASAVMASGISP